MSKTLNVNYVCKECGHVDIVKKTKKQQAFFIAKAGIKGILLAIMIGFALMGFIGTIQFFQEVDMNDIEYFFYGGDSDDQESLFSLGNVWGAYLNFKVDHLSNGDQDILWHITKNITHDPCYQEDGEYYYNNKTVLCVTEAIYDHLVSTIEYEEGNAQDPIRTYYEGSGDCDEMTTLYVALLASHFIDAKIQCTNVHCWAILSYDDYLIKSDIAKGYYRVTKNGTTITEKEEEDG